MKKSKYNRFIDIDSDRKIAFNSLTCALAEVDKDFFALYEDIENININSLSDKEKELLSQMKEGNFINEDELDELKLLKYRNYSGKFTEGTFGYVLAPTVACNFACPYCYETAKSGFMSEKVLNKLLENIEKAAKQGRNIDNTWYGGEPLLAKNIIRDFSDKCVEICEKYSVDYSAYIVTNGYLINDEIVQILKNAHVKGAQITIDGPPEIHNQRRILKNSKEPTFDVILNNAKKLLDSGIKNICIRINVDKTNVNQVERLLDIFEEKGLHDVTVNLGHVTAYTDACSSVANSCLSVKEYAENDVKYQKVLNDRGYKVAQSYPYYPGVKANYCCADHANAFVIDPEGYMYKCWNDVGNIDRAVGNVCEEEQDEKRFALNLDYIMWSPFEHEKCVECDILPICMGGCPYSGLHYDEPKCEKWIYSLDETIKATYFQNSEEQIG